MWQTIKLSVCHIFKLYFFHTERMLSSNKQIVTGDNGYSKKSSFLTVFRIAQITAHFIHWQT